MSVVVTDASALVEYLLDPARAHVARAVIEDAASVLCAPALCDVEIVAALRRACLHAAMDTKRALEVLADYVDLPLTRYAHEPLLARAFELRENFSAYDATYAALAEHLGAELLTADGPFGSAADVHLRLTVHHQPAAT